ncbi:MAG TPA: sodium:solute symporter [Cytophagales bacterium]|nr:sodium:solute symporter [Cytophagales bacterium]
MSQPDWIVLIFTLFAIVLFGIWKGRGKKDLHGYFVGNTTIPWFTIGLSVMATQASAITFLSTPGQGFSDGMRFVQFYLGLPLAMVVLCITAVPFYQKLKVYTAYEFLEKRFDLKTRSLASFLFLLQRSVSTGLSLLAPSIIFSTILGWNLTLTNILIGGIVIVYTVSGGTMAVSQTHKLQMSIVFLGLFVASCMVIYKLPDNVSFANAVDVAGTMGKLNAITFDFDLENRYNIWAGLIGGFFLQLSYFGTDQSQVGRYLAGQSIYQSRLGLLFNGLLKIPMQFLILFIGVMVFIFYQFSQPPIYFNKVEKEKIYASPYADEFKELEKEYNTTFREKKELLDLYVAGKNNGSETKEIEQNLRAIQDDSEHIRSQAIEIVKKNNPSVPKDTDYMFINFIIDYLPIGTVGVLLAMIFAASMSSAASAYNSLSSTTVVDIYKRILKKDGTDAHYVSVSKWSTLFWGVFAILFAEFASRLGNLIEAVNILGSLFYGTILGIFLIAFYFKTIKGSAVFYAALIAQIIVTTIHFLIEYEVFKLSYLWYNVIGCLSVLGIAFLINGFYKNEELRSVEEAMK